jgi:O-antigen ligase
MDLALALPLGAAAGAALGWLGWRWPGALLALALASLALGLQWILADHLPQAVRALTLPAQKLLLLAALVANAVRFGLRRDIVPWPLLAVAALALQSLLLADLDPRLGPAAMAEAALDLALPWLLVNLVVAPGSRDRLALLLMLLAAACVGAGALLHVAEVRNLYFGSASRGLRLSGASNAGWLACLAFAGFAIALHEAVLRRRRALVALAALNVVITVLTGGRMGMVACLVLALAYLGFARPAATRHGLLPTAALGLGAAAVFLLLGVRLVEGYNVEQLEEVFSLTGRGTIWLHYLDEFRMSPLFGRGLGAGLLGRNYYDLPHNEYLRLLVEGGIVGAVLYGGAVVLWGRQVLARTAADERAFVRALFIALAVYALTDNILTMPPGLVPFVYLALLLGEPRAAPALAEAPPAAAPPAAARKSPAGDH